MSDFNLRHLVRDVLATSPLTDPHALADEVLGRIDDDDLRPALGQVLASMVREEIRSRRGGGLPPLPPVPPPSGPPTGPRLTLHRQSQVMAESPGPVPRPVAKVAPAPIRQPGRSAKVAAIRAAGPKWLEERYNVGADPREWKRPCARPECGGELHTDPWGTPVQCPHAEPVVQADTGRRCPRCDCPDGHEQCQHCKICPHADPDPVARLDLARQYARVQRDYWQRRLEKLDRHAEALADKETP